MDSKVRSSITIIIWIAILPFASAQCDLTNLFGEFDIPDNQDTCLSVTFSGVVNDDLSLATLFTGIELEFEHDAVSDLVIDLTSPAGQTITIVGDINSNGNLTTGADWNVLFAECAGGTSPDSGISDTWDNDEPWVIGGSYSGIYYPSGGCFEDFNVGSVNGTWTICIRDGVQFNEGRIKRIGFVLTGVNSSNCNQCSAEAGDQTISDITVCSNEDLNIDLGLSGATMDADYSTIYLVSENSNFVTFNTDGNFIGLSDGLYEICAISVLTDDLPSFLNSGLTYQELQDGFANNTLAYCADIADNCSLLTINEAPPIEVIDEVICQGEQIRIGTDIFDTSGSFQALKPKTGSDLCDTNVVLNLEVIAIGPIIQASSSEFSCVNNTILLDANSSLQGSSSTFLWSTTNGVIVGDPTAMSIEVSQAGTYVLEQTESSCVLSTSITLAGAQDIPTINTSSELITCSEDVVTINLSSSSSITGVTWNGPGGFTSSENEPSVSAAGRYEALVSHSDGCVVSIFHEVEQGGDLPVITASAPTLSCTSTSVTITVSDTSFPTYRWTGPQGFVSNIAEPNATRTGTYYLEVTNSSGCKGFTSVEVFGDVVTFDYEIFGEDFLCPRGTTTISASSEAGNAIYSWTGPNNFFSSEAVNEVSSEGTYYVEIRSNGCMVTDSIQIGRNLSDLPEYDVQIENLGDCENPLWRLTAIPIANEFQTSQLMWGINGVSIVGVGASLDVRSSGRYFLRVLSQSGCVVFKNFTINPSPSSPLIQQQSKQNVNCTTGLSSGRIEMLEEADKIYSWTSSTFPNFSGDSSVIENLAAGFYELTVTDTITNCVSFFNTRIVADTIPRNITSRNTNIDCNNPQAEIFITTNGGGNTYNWEGPEGNNTSQNLSVTTAGNYMLTVTGGNGCLSFDTITILEDIAPPSINLVGGGLECETQSISLDPNVSEQGATYSWSGPGDFLSNVAIPVVFSTGDYNLTVTGLNGCTSLGSATVTANPDTPIPLATSPQSLTCQDTLIQIFGDANVDIVAYSWSGPSSFISDQQNPFISEAGDYIVTAQSTQGCIGFDTVTVEEIIILPDVSYNFDAAVDCININAQLEGISTDPQASFSWSGPNGYNESGQVVLAQDTGTYFYFIRGSNNCIASDTFQIGVENIDISSTYTSTCGNPGLQVEELSDSLSYSIMWSGPNGFTSSETSPQPQESGTYNGLVVGSSGCTANVTSSVDFDTITPQAGISQIGEIRCEDNIINLDGSGSDIGGNFTYAWSTSNGSILQGIDSFTSQIQGVGDYELVVTNLNNGCEELAMISVEEEVQEFNAISFITENPRCFGENNGFVTFTNGNGGTAPYTYSLDGNFFSSDATIGNLSPGTYNYTVKDSFGCIVAESFTIDETPDLELDLGGTIDVFLGNETEISANINLTMEQIASIEWQIANQLGCSDCLSFTLTPNEDLIIDLKIVDDRGCEVSDQVKVRVDQEPVLFKPNAFSPNEDGFNDVFYIYSNPGVSSIKYLSIYDRWGNNVFSNRNFSPGDPTQGWDGSFDGTKAQNGVYSYIVEVEMITGVSRMVRGNVTLLR